MKLVRYFLRNEGVIFMFNFLYILIFMVLLIPSGDVCAKEDMKNLTIKEEDGVTYEFHHIGIPTIDKREGERYSPTFKMYTSDGLGTRFRVQYHRFEDGSSLHPLIKTMTHVAFKVSDMQKAIKGYPLLLGPYFPFEGFEVAIVEINGMPIEFIKTNLSEEEIWGDEPKSNSCIYPEDNKK